MKKRLLSLFIALALMVSMVPMSIAGATSQFVDFPTGWSNEAMTAAVNNGLLFGYDNDHIGPKNLLTRAEMAAVITRAFGAVTECDISSYSDVFKNSWYYNSVARAVKMGAMSGISAVQMAPMRPITREELFSVLARVLVLSSSDASVLNKFNDGNDVSSWALNTVSAMVARGYVNGDDLGNLNPHAYITREEFAQVMHNAIRTYIVKPGTYTADMEGITVIRVGDVAIKNLKNTSDLVIGDGVLKGKIYINDVTIGLRLLARGGTITVKNSTLGDKVVVNNVNGTTHFNNYRSEKFFKNIVENTKATFLQSGSSTSRNDDEEPETTATVKFYNGYPGIVLIEDEIVNVGETIDPSLIPAISEDDYKKGYIEDDDLAEVYDNEEYTHKIAPTYWYINSDGEFEPFDETVVIEGDMDVYLLTKMFMLSLKFESVSQPIGLLAYYNDDVRFADTAKDLLYDGKNKIETAGALIPKYNDAKNAAKQKLADVGLIDNDGNIKYLKISLPISKLVKKATVKNMVREHIEDVIMGRDTNVEDVYYFIKQLGISGLSSNAEIISFIDTLSDDQKRTFASEIYNNKEALEAYNNLVDDLMSKDELTLKPEEYPVIINVAHAIAKLDYDKMMEQSGDNAIVNALIDLIGEDTFKEYFFEMRDQYAEGFIEKMEEAKAQNQNKAYTTHLSLKLNLIEIIKGYYEKAQDKLIDKLESAGVNYNENKYLRYLAEHNAIEKLFASTPVTDELTGYKLRSDIEYYNYLLGLIMAADDALTYYGTLDQAEFEAVYDSLFLFIDAIHGKLNGMIEAFVTTGALPEKLNKVISSVEQAESLLSKYESKIKSVLTSYLESSINVKIESGALKGNTATIKIRDILIGNEDPRFTLDTIYSIFYSKEDFVQEKLQALIDSGKLEVAIEKFESTDFGALFTSVGAPDSMADKIAEIASSGKVQSTLDSLMQMLELVAEYGIEVFEVDSTGETVIDAYKLEFAGITITIQRSFE